MDRTQQRIIDLIDARRDEIVAFARDVFTHAELGYKEFRTAGKFEEQLQKLALPKIEAKLAVTGVKGYLKDPAAASSGPTLALIGELDALRIPTHPCANPETQGAHSCGHHAQLAGVLGAAFALADPAVAQTLNGNVVFFAVPAEEYGEIAFKNSLRDQGAIRYGGGKCELIRIGAFDDIDLSVVHHSGSGISVGNGSSNGFVSKTVHIKGRAAHAAGAPHQGVNALNAAALGHTALQYQRETFRDEDSVRVHPIVTQGGDLVNVIPDSVRLEMLVRAKNLEAIQDANRKTDRAYKAGADALGAGYEIETMPGYLPRIPCAAHPAVVEAAKLAAPHADIELADPASHMAGSTDVGDLQHIQPVLSFTTSGVAGPLHSPVFEVVDEDEAYITTAKIFALSAYRLLQNGAQQAKDIVASYNAPLNKQSYIDFMESLMKTETKEVTGNA